MSRGRSRSVRTCATRSSCSTSWITGLHQLPARHPDLERLEAEYPDELVVIGVHSAKFTEEGETEAIRQAVLRSGLEHPVVNDRDFVVWNQYGLGDGPISC